MTTDLENQLRASLHDEATRVPDAAVMRLTTHPYRPRRRRLRRPAAIGLGGAGLAGGAAAAIALLGTASPAFAGWTPQPTTPGPGQLQAASSDCAPHLPSQNLPLKLSDVRGPFTFEIYADDQNSATCITGPSFTSAAGMSASAPIRVPSGTLLLTDSHTGQDGSSAYSWADGRVASDVTRATLTLADGTTVSATVQNGWFVAWWPGSSSVVSAQVTGASGTTTETIEGGGLTIPGGASSSQVDVSGVGGHEHGTVSSYQSAPQAGSGTGTGSSTTPNPSTTTVTGPAPSTTTAASTTGG